MNKFLSHILSTLSLLALSCSLEAAVPVTKTHTNSSKTEEKYDLMRRDQIDTTDALAIPLDESEIEDEEQIDLDERKDVFPLPHESR